MQALYERGHILDRLDRLDRTFNPNAAVGDHKLCSLDESVTKCIKEGVVRTGVGVFLKLVELSKPHTPTVERF